MNNSEETPLGKLGYLVLPLAILLVFILGVSWITVAIVAGIGALIANVRATLFVGRLDQIENTHHLLKLQSEVSGVNNSTKIRYIFMQSLIGALVCAIWTGAVCGIFLLFR